MMGRKMLSQMGESQSNKMKSLSKAQLPTEMGLFPQTFIPSPWRTYLPLLRSNYKFWLKIQWMLIKKPFVNNFG